jgi:hypothetical protein
MTNTESISQVEQSAEGTLLGASPILNHKLRGPNETFWDAMDQGRAEKSQECRARIVDILKRADKN